jgi:hypothetical protein
MTKGREAGKSSSMIEFMECEGEINLWTLREAQPHLFELVTSESRSDGKGEITFLATAPGVP